MDNERFEALVKNLEQQAIRDPATYQLKVMSLALLGNAYVGGILLLLIATLVALCISIVFLKALAIKLIIVVGVFLVPLIGALRVKIDPPAGTEVTRRQAPELFAMIDELRRGLGAPAFHHVLISDDLNAGVIQSPRLGIFGWPRNYLLIGLPLMKLLTLDQFKAVLAHEFGHLAKGHGRWSNWIYRQRLRWSRLLSVLEQQGGNGSFLFKPFMSRFVPYFNAYSFPMARANEFAADAAAVRLTSAGSMAEALTSVNVMHAFLTEKYWPGIHGRASDTPSPAFAPFLEMGRSIGRDLDAVAAESWLKQAMSRQTDITDTHPALSDRLKAIGQPCRLQPPQDGKSADTLLGDALMPITESFDKRWAEGISASWQAHYQNVQQGRKRLAELESKLAGPDELSIQEAYERAGLTASIGNDPESSLQQFQSLHQRAPDIPAIIYGLGVRLLARGDGNGHQLIEQAMARDEWLIVSGCELLRDYHLHGGRIERAREWHARLLDRIQLQNAAAEERNQVLTSDEFKKHDIADAAISAMQDQLKNVRGLKKVYLVRKRVTHMAHRPCYVAGFTVTGLLQLHSDKRAQEVSTALASTVPFPEGTVIINVEGDNYKFGRKLRWMRGSRIF